MDKSRFKCYDRCVNGLKSMTRSGTSAASSRNPPREVHTSWAVRSRWYGGGERERAREARTLVSRTGLRDFLAWGSHLGNPIATREVEHRIIALGLNSNWRLHVCICVYVLHNETLRLLKGFYLEAYRSPRVIWLYMLE